MRLYIEHYSKIHKGKTMAFATREGILRDNHKLIIEDLKFLTRIGIEIVLFHNIANNLGNNRFLKENIQDKIKKVKLKRIPSDQDFYKFILDLKLKVDKLIFLERQALSSEDGLRINTMSTKKILSINNGNDFELSNLGISNINFRHSLLKICNSIESGNIGRVHILPGGEKNVIKKELFSIEGAGTLIGQDFGEPSIRQISTGEEEIILGILKSHKRNPYLKPRTKEYVKSNLGNFFIAEIDGIPVGCVEKIELNEDTIELGALSVIETFLDFKVGKSLINMIEEIAFKKGKIIISLTNNPVLQNIYKKRGYEEDKDGFFEERSRKSPGVKLFYKEHY